MPSTSSKNAQAHEGRCLKKSMKAKDKAEGNLSSHCKTGSNR